MHVIDHDTVAAPERHLVTAEALDNHLIEGMAELTEILLPGRTASRRNREIILPSGHQSVALEPVVLQMQVVDGTSHNIHVTRPLVHLVIVLQEHREHIVIIEVLL